MEMKLKDLLDNQINDLLTRIEEEPSAIEEEDEDDIELEEDDQYYE